MTEQRTQIEVDRLVAEREDLPIRLLWFTASLACLQDHVQGATEAFINTVRPHPPYKWKSGRPLCKIEEAND